MQILRVFFTFLRLLFRELSTVLISYGKLLKIARSQQQPARKARKGSKAPSSNLKKVRTTSKG